ncbi:hypothetical protein FOE78_05475 [Microlunatus elymi]|uniref:Uncharacterized protein n=1 Tax=Microlunatus elymi TaxID=2596828 RepID=A0A516PWW4_9ACTN|nr:hypothetical protein [Microlunatus elymi]QDP95431.1 hypothetical protein FOE78_05475 [Microlunatus elymi]
MNMGVARMARVWLVVLSWCGLALGFISAAWVVVEVFVRRYRQPMPIMEAVWPITGLYFGPAAVWGSHRFGRPMTRRWQASHNYTSRRKPRWAFDELTFHCVPGRRRCGARRPAGV